MTDEEQEELNQTLRVMLFNEAPIDEIKGIVDKGADVHFKDSNGETFLMLARNAEQTEFLIKAGVDVNAKTTNWQVTALMKARNAAQTKLLLEAGADVSACDGGGNTALWWAKTPEQAALLEGAAKKAEEGVKKHISQRKALILKSRQLRKEIEKRHPEEKVSDLALVDEIVRDKISGKEKRTITPEIGAEIKRRKAAEK